MCTGRFGIRGVVRGTALAMAALALGTGAASAETYTINTLTADELDAILHHDPLSNLSDDAISEFEYSSIDGVAVLSATIGQTHESSAYVVQVAINNVLHEDAVAHRNLIVGSFGGNRGIVSVNQDSGSFNNQANVRAISIGGGDGAAFQQAEAWGVQVVGGNVVTATGGGGYHNSIESSFNGGSGIVGVNQAAGSANAQANLVALTFSTGAGVEVLALGDSTLAQVSGDNDVNVDDQTPRSNTVSDSFNGFSGVAQVNQAAGNANAVGQSIGINANVRTLP